MSISFSTVSTVFIEFVNQTLIPVLDNNNPVCLNCLQKWQQFTQTIMKKISNFTSEQELIKKVKAIINSKKKDKIVQNSLQQKAQTQLDQRASSIRVTFTEGQRIPKPSQIQDLLQLKKPQEKQKQQTIQFRDRKISLDEVSSRKNKYEQQTITRKQQRSGSFNLPTGLEGNIIVQIPLIRTPTQQQTQKSRSSYVRKDNEVMSFNSISDFHKSRNNIPPANKQVNQSQLPLILPPQLKMMSKKSIEDYNPISLTQNRPNSYSTNYIQSIKKINIESRSPNQKSKPTYSQIQTPQDFVQTTPVKLLQPQADGSTLSNIKKKISQGSDYINSPPPGTSDSFSKFMNSFKKLCNTFESNHHKLMREDFNNKYINC